MGMTSALLDSSLLPAECLMSPEKLLCPAIAPVLNIAVTETTDENRLKVFTNISDDKMFQVVSFCFQGCCRHCYSNSRHEILCHALRLFGPS